MNGDPLDLVILLPGLDERETIEGLLATRQPNLGIPPIRYEVLVHPRHDPGCFHEGPAILQPYARRARHALVIFDHYGSGQEVRPAAEVAADVKARIETLGWEGRAEVLVLQPELETWVFSDSPQVDRALGWGQANPPLRQWLREQGLWPEQATKPPDPKKSMRAALRKVKLSPSSAIFRRLARTVGLERCQDTSFARLRLVLREWFGGAA